MSCSAGHRHSSDLALLWLWHRPEALALIHSSPSMGIFICCGCRPRKTKKNFLLLFYILIHLIGEKPSPDMAGLGGELPFLSASQPQPLCGALAFADQQLGEHSWRIG